ncbi:hypothetical protein PHET_01331 [Paragonimus heterotremus]|uniref:Uncharacterized protein n=1 Tax=Paragonimus heterotremus TaxID=100268 RepID=A0A8J4X352_9TREM|nr:hypothetical protein PHET_01331 [Paragonimus heterotremus]
MYTIITCHNSMKLNNLILSMLLACLVMVECNIERNGTAVETIDELPNKVSLKISMELEELINVINRRLDKTVGLYDIPPAMKFSLDVIKHTVTSSIRGAQNSLQTVSQQ